MPFYENFLRPLTLLGTRGCFDLELKRRIIVLNKLSIFFVIVCFLFIPLFFFTGFVVPGLMAAVVTISYALPFYLNWLGRYTLARVWSYATVTVAATSYAVVLGGGFQIQLALYPAAALPFIYFGRDKHRLVYALFGLALLGFVLQHWLQRHAVVSYEDSLPLFIFSLFMTTNSFLMLGMSLITLNEDARIAELKLRAATLEKRKLISLLCHDIANPLTLCFFGSTKLRDSLQTNPSVANAQKKLDLGLSNIKEIIDSVRYLEATELGKIHILSQPVDILAVIYESLTLLSDRFEQKKIKLEVISRIPKDVGVLGDHAIIKNNILCNLLTNALKFSPENSKVIVALNCIDDKVLLKVSDEGIGMPTELMKKVFESAAMTSRIGLDGEKGTGFGLPLVKSLMEKLGGDVSVTSQEKTDEGDSSGTCFLLSFPKANL